MTGKRIALGFWSLSLICLITGLFFGMAGSLQYVLPGFLKDQFSFAHMRPLHVFLITQWISGAATGSMYYFIPGIAKRKLFSPVLAQVHLVMQMVIIMVAVSDFFIGNFTGREYMEFPLWMAGVMVLGWIFALVNFIGTVRPKFDKAPVYIWSWTTGLIFFIITITEATLWQFDHFNFNIIRDVTIQWKALGSMVGAWNMLIYGSAVYVMCRISKTDEMARSKPAFFFYFLGLTNLMFNWGHHTYVVPASPVVRIISYVISMTELLILFNMIWKWSKTLTKEDKAQHLSYRMLKMTDNWILLNLTLAILISIPALNQYTHGTHVTVAHAMGATIGINTTILLAAGFYIFSIEKRLTAFNVSASRQFVLGLFNVSLLVFWISLIGSGIAKAASVNENKPFAEIMIKLKPWFHVFSFSGFMLMIAIIFLAAPLLRFFIKPGIQVNHHPTALSVSKSKEVEVADAALEHV